MLHLILAFAQCTVMNLNKLLSSGSLGKGLISKLANSKINECTLITLLNNLKNKH